jgi:hydrogenase-4 component F
MVGYAILAAVLPATLPAVLLVLVRHQALLAGTALGTRMDMLMIWFGLAAALGCGLLLAGAVEARRGTLVPPALMPMGTIALGQGAIAVFAFGLGSPDAAFAATLHLVLLVLTGAAAGLSRTGEASRCAALAGLAGIPPFGVFPSLVLILLAAARQSPWTVAPLAVSLALLGWGSVRRLPPLRPLTVTTPGRTRGRPASLAPEQIAPERNTYARESALPVSLDAIPAWLPLVLALLIGLLMPDSLAEWLRQASAGLP